MTEGQYNVLFLCTHNSARSIMAEAALRRWGHGKFNAFSAGSDPVGVIHPLTLRILERMNHRISDFRSKSWDEFAEPQAPRMDFVFTVCDATAGQSCPAWPGKPMTAHWGIEDPLAFVGSPKDQEAYFHRVYTYLDNRIKIFAALPIRALDQLRLQNRLDEIGLVRDVSTAAQ